MRENSPSILDRLGVSTDSPANEQDSFDDLDDYRAFGFSRKPWGGDPMFEVIFKNGLREGYAYADLRRVMHDPAIGLTLKFVDSQLVISGRKLTTAHVRFLQHRVVFVCEADRASIKLADASGEPVVTGVTEEPLRPKASTIAAVEFFPEDA